MATAVINFGRSGTGKSYATRTMPDEDFGIINVIGKPLPYKNKRKCLKSTDYGEIKHALKEAKAKSIYLDDASYLLTDMFMRKHSSCGGGNAVFSLYNDIGDSFYDLMRFIAVELPDDMIVYVVMHEDTDDYGRSKIKTIGKLLDEKVTLEGLVTITLHSICENGEYLVETNGEGIWKSPPEMFESERVPNDLKLIDDAIRSYYNMPPLGGDAS